MLLGIFALVCITGGILALSLSVVIERVGKERGQAFFVCLIGIMNMVFGLLLFKKLLW